MSDVFGITGWKNSGKTTLVAALVKTLTADGFRVSTIKHASSSFEIDQPGTDSFSHREAGAHETAIVSDEKWAIIHQTHSPAEAPTLAAMLGKLAPCDLVLVEGFKTSNIPKIECIRKESVKDAAIWQRNKSVAALATDHEIDECDLPQFDINDVRKIADYIAQISGLEIT